MRPEAFEGRPEPGQDGRDAPDPVPIPLTERVGDARPDPGLSFAGIVQQAGEEEVGIGHAIRAQRRLDVEAVTPVGDVHRVEEGELGGRGPGRQRRTLLGRHASPGGAPGTGGPY